jgi:hypothetical protein
MNDLADDPMKNPEFRLLIRFWMAKEIGNDLTEAQYEMAHRSTAFRALMRSAHENPGWDALHSLTLIWERSGSPEGKSPREYLADLDACVEEGQVVEDRGESGKHASFEAAAWYAHFIDPTNFPLDAVLDYVV